jgi:hypothetical protein
MMSEEALLVLKMVQEGKITPEQGVAFLEALKQNDAPGAATAGPSSQESSNSGGSWRAASHAQQFLAQLQQQLAEMQAKIGAAQAGSRAGSNTSSSVKLPFGMGEFNITQIIDDTMKGVSAIRNEAVISAKKAARQAQKEARRFRVEAERLGKNIHVEVHVRTDGRPINATGLPEASAREEVSFDLPEDGLIAIRNPFGDIKVTGASADDKVHADADKKVWAGSPTQREDGLQKVKIEEVLRPDGRGRELVITVPDEISAENASVNLSVQVPPRARVEVFTTYGNIHCESIDGGVSRVETETGDIRLLHIHGAAPAAEGESRIHTVAGSISVSQWRAGALSVECASGGVKLDTIEAPRLNVRAASGDVQARGVKAVGELHLEALSGDLHLEDAETSAGGFVKTHSGDLALSRVTASSLTLDTVSGDIVATDASCAGGRVAIKAISGDLQIKGLAAGEVSLNTTSGDVDVAMAAGFSGSIACATVSGDASLSLPAGYQARLTMTTHSGNLNCAFPLSAQEGDGEHYLNGVIGDSAAAPASAMLQSVSGDLSIKNSA